MRRWSTSWPDHRQLAHRRAIASGVESPATAVKRTVNAVAGADRTLTRRKARQDPGGFPAARAPERRGRAPPANHDTEPEEFPHPDDRREEHHRAHRQDD